MDLAKRLKHYRMSQSEYELACEKLGGREPQGVEWALFSALWSEHCSYKSSRVHLKKFFSKSERVVTGFGENAGVIDLGEGERVAFKIESHNHPSFIEPYQGAATGVGGILRDVFTMGARPIALANYLCFGQPTADRMPYLMDGVVRGISGYGNCVGVPNITGQTEFDKSYNKNVLVNALALGLFRPGEKIFTAPARGPGNLVVYVGAKTGKDGVHGASMASESFDDKNETKKPTIQKGDPFFEKLLIESCIEVMKENLVVAIQDMGAAGLTSSSFEMAARGGLGMHMHLDRVPLRDSSMTPEEILLSESQERMLLVCEPANLKKIQAVFSRWDLDAAAIGEVTQAPEIKLFWHGETICEIDPKILVDEAPKYERPYKAWTPKNKVEKVKPVTVKNSSVTLQNILGHHFGGSRQWIYEQYDQRVGTKTVRDCSDSVGILRLPDSKRGLGLVLGCRPYLMRMDARLGAIDAVAHPSLELAAKGFLPLAATDCLNFGNPENQEIMSEFVATVENMSAQCEALGTPVISGNVSFYNETLGQNITSTPATGIVGLRDSIEQIPQSHFVEVGDDVFLLHMKGVELNGRIGELGAEVGASGAEGVWFSGDLNVKTVAEFCTLVRHLALLKGVRSSRVVGQFGLAYALARMCIGSGRGLEVKDLKTPLFEERLYEVVFAMTPAEAHELQRVFESLATNQPFTLQRIGTVRGDRLKLSGKAGEAEIDTPVKDLQAAYLQPQAFKSQSEGSSI